MKTSNPHDEKYAGKEYYWGKKPSAICDRVIELMHPTRDFRPKLVDLGCGEGRNAVYFAKNGFDVVGLDISETGLEKMKRFAEEEVCLRAVKADITRYELTETYDVIFSTGTLHYLPPNVRTQRFQTCKDHTSSTGINAFSVFVKKPFITKASDADAKVRPFKSGELMGYYWDWEITYCIEEIFDCMSSGIPHKHAVNRIITGRYQQQEKNRC